MKKIKILFVDDDDRLLDGLKRILRKKRKEWDVLFCSGGRQALDIIARESIAIIVADMRMPEMSGAEILKEVKSQYPTTIRFILSGQSDKENILESINNAHIFLAKPCSQETLLEVLERASTLHDLISQSNIGELTTQIGSLPSIPELFERLRSEIDSEDASIENVAEIISGDPAMSTKILQIVNSAFYSLPKKVSSAIEATKILGLDTLSTMVLSEEIFQKITPEISARFNLDQMWAHTNKTALLAKEIAKAEKMPAKKINEASTSGLLHDVGKLILASSDPDLYQNIINASKANPNLSIEDAEKNTIGASSSQIGAYLLGLWGLPNEVVKSVANYRSPIKIQQDDVSSIASIIAFSEYAERYISNGSTEKIDVAYEAKKLGVSEKKYQGWLDIAGRVLDA